jgi:uncharacterized protein (TIGR02453 family)
MKFTGWSEKALDFYEGLEADNSKTYWAANRDVYEGEVLAPMQALLAELAPRFGEGKIFRPYRDVRFSRDKSPYKTAVAAVVGSGYVQLSASGLAAGNGMYVMSSDQLDRYRRAVDAETSGEELRSVIAAIERHQIEVNGHETLKTGPKGYPRDHPRIDLLCHRGLVAWKQWPHARWLATAGAKTRIVAFLEESAPLSDWLTAHVGPPHDADE